MNVLINQNFKAMRTGQFVSANADAGEFILDTESSDHTNATLIEIASTNKISGVSKNNKKEENLAALETGFSAMKLPEQSKEPESEVVKRIVQEGLDAGLEDDDIVVEIITKGKIKYKAAIKMFQQAVIELGVRVSTKDRKEAVKKILVTADFRPENYSDVMDMASHIAGEIEDTTNVQAIKLIRSYCKEFEIPFPKQEKAVRGSLRTQSLAWMLRNPTADRAAMDKWANSTGKVKNPKMLDRMWSTFEFAKKVAQATIAAQTSGANPAE